MSHVMDYYHGLETTYTERAVNYDKLRQGTYTNKAWFPKALKAFLQVPIQPFALN